MRKIILFAFAFLFLASSINAYSLSDGLKAYYDFGQTSGPVIDSASGNNGTMVGSSFLRNVTGKVGGALQLNGVDAYVDILNSNDFQFNNEYTIFFWVKFPMSQSTSSGLISKVPSGTGPFRLSMNNLGKDDYNFQSWDSGGQVYNVSYQPMNTSNVFEFVALTLNATNMSILINGTIRGTTGHGITSLKNNLNDLFIGSGYAGLMNGTIDELGIFNRSLNQTEIQQLYNLGNGSTYNGTSFIFTSAPYLSISLMSPGNSSQLSDFGTNFTVVGIAKNYNFTNVTFYLWNSTGALVNQTTKSLLGQNQNTSIQFIDNFNIGQYQWSAQLCGKNLTTDGICVMPNFNFTFLVGAVTSSLKYNLLTYETAHENFFASFAVLPNAQIALAQLVYNGTNYTISNLSMINSTLFLSRDIDLPTISTPYGTEQKSFFFRFTYSGSFVQETSLQYQNVSFIDLEICNDTYNVPTLNFTLRDQENSSLINSSLFPTTFQTDFRYWVGTGATYKNYSFKSLSGQSNNFTFCLSPNNQSFQMKTDMDSLFFATNYAESSYYLRNASISNSTSNIPLYLLLSSLATKFTFTVQQGSTPLNNVIVIVSKQFIGDGNYKTTAIKLTDSVGTFVDYADLDRNYRFYVIQDGVLLGTIDKQLSCSSAPCSEVLQVGGSSNDLFAPYDAEFASNVVSNISFDPASKTVTYTFLDITGLAKYFRFIVGKSYINNTVNKIICDQYSYSSSGSMTCNVTGFDGDFFAKGLISRSPEKEDKSITFILSTLASSWGLAGIVLSLGIMITMIFASASVSKGNPTVIVFVFALVFLILKLMTLSPLSWTVVVLVELICLFIMSQVRT